MIDDSELLRRYANHAAEPAFAEVVQRHINFVYACALRRVGGDAHLAEDVAQNVFTALARQATTVAKHQALSGWLYTTTRNVAAQLVRSERRRHARETTAVLMQSLNSPTTQDSEWERLRPVLDDAMDGMSGDDRQAVLLRYFDGQSYADIGARLRLAENTARMRVDRALEKLRAALERRGVTSTTAGLTLALAHHAGVAAPAGLAASVTSTAVTTAAAATAAGASGWFAGAFGLGALQTGTVAVVALAGASAYVSQVRENSALRQEIATLHATRSTLPALQQENRQLVAAAAEVEMLRRDDTEFKQLATRVAEVKRAQQETTQRAQAAALGQRRQLEDWIREQDRLSQVEVERMNKEGNALVKDYKQLAAQAKDATLDAAARSAADAATKLKLAEIQAKQKEIKDYIADTKRRLAEYLPELRRLATLSGTAEPPGAFVARETGELTLRRAEIEQRRAARDPNTPAPESVPGKITLKPRAQTAGELPPTVSARKSTATNSPH